jgi:DNA repair protein RecN (Recombination protein N)
LSPTFRRSPAARSALLTTTTVETLSDAARVAEVARMLGGDPESAVSLDHARELLERGIAGSRSAAG